MKDHIPDISKKVSESNEAKPSSLERAGCAAPMVDQDGTCGYECPHWQSLSDENLMAAKCNLLGKELTYYDGWQAECEAQHNNNSTESR